MKKLYSLLVALSAAGYVNAQSYCTPSCSNPSGGCTYGRISTFKILTSVDSLRDTLGCTGSGFEDYHSSASAPLTCTLTLGSSGTGLISSAYPSPKYTQVWVDYNHDGNFDSSEVLGGANSWGYNTTFSYTVPSSATTGTTRMRLVSEYGSTSYYFPNMRPCMGSGYTFGDARDYTVTIVSGGSSSGCTGTPSAGTASVSTSGTCGYHWIVLSDAGASSGSGITYQWEQSTDGGSTWTSVSGAVATTYTMAEPTVNTLYRCVVSCSGGSSATTSSVSVSVSRINGHISYGTATPPDTMSLKVWLIDYNAGAGTLYAVDSVVTCLDSMAPYFEFNGVAAATYFVKAKSLDATSSMVGSSGFVPTYGASSAHWSSASPIYYASGISTQNITMVYGTVPSGPGFIGGTISSGAGKNTASDIPAVNMLVFLKNATTGVITQAYTDATGHYAFNGIAYGTYFIYPEDMGYATTPSATLTLTSSHASETAVNFKQYTTSKKILPIGVGVPTVAEPKAFSVYPNPTSGSVNIQWDALATGTADINITDAAGRTVYATTLSINATSGKSTISLPSLSNGVYFVKIKSETINYTERLSVQH